MTESKSNQTWGVGVELTADHMGPLRFAAALASGTDRVVGIHVMPDQERLHPLVSRDEATALRQRITDDVARLLVQHGIAREQVSARVVEDDYPALALVEQASQQGLDALVIGRRARRDEDPIVRLGEVARRILRKLPAPVIVVPPDFGEGEGLSPGPVIVATDLTEHCVPAARFGARLAERFGRPLLFAHGTQGFHWGVSYVPAEALERLLEQSRADASAKLSEWATSIGLGHAQQHVFLGDPARNLVDLSFEHEAALLVTGSRALGPIERIFLASVSSEVASSTRCPTAVVPG